MSSILVTLREIGSCSIKHQESGAVITSDTPPEYGGQGRSFSATDLLAAALGTCIATSIDALVVRHGIPLDAIKIEVEKELAVEPKRVARLTVSIQVAMEITREVSLRIQRAAEICVVKRSLHPNVAVEVNVVQVCSPTKGE